MIRIIFKNDISVGYATVGYSSSDNEEIIKEKSEEELNDLLSPILEEEENWKDKYQYLSLDENEEIYCDEDRYETDQDEKK